MNAFTEDSAGSQEAAENQSVSAEILPEMEEYLQNSCGGSRKTE